ESSVDCANQFVEEGVVAAVQGVDVAADAALPVLSEANIAEIAFFAFTPGVNVAEGEAFTTLFSIEEGYAASLIAQKELGATNVAALIVDLPSGHAVYEDVVAPVAEQLGMNVTPFFYVQATVDWTSFAATVMATNPDGVSMGAPTEADCTAALPAFDAAGFEGVLHLGSCVEFRTSFDADMVEGVVNHAEFYTSAMTEIPDKPAADIAIYREYMEAEEPDYVDTTYGTLGFAIAVDAADMLRQVPGDEYTASTVLEALPAAQGVKFFTDTPYDCSAPLWPGTTACGSGALYARNLGDGELELLDFSPVDVSEVVPD
ncbi:MAG: ABC transporter substrate-binding protein, partial [Desertimonas sp.]